MQLELFPDRSKVTLRLSVVEMRCECVLADEATVVTRNVYTDRRQAVQCVEEV